MQIFEITQPKRVNEIVGALASGIAKAGFNKFVQSQTGSPAFDPAGSGANARMGAFKANQALVGPLATQLQAAWAQAVQEFMSRTKDAAGNPTTNLSAMSPASFNAIKPQLVTLINNSIGPNADYAGLPNSVGDDPTVKGAADAAKEAIDKGIDAVMNATVKPGNNTPQLADAWTEIVRDGIAPAKQISQFDPRSSGGQTQQKGQIKLTQDTRGNWLVNGQPFNAKDPVHAQAMQSLQQQAGGKP